MPAPIGNASAFFPPNMTSFWGPGSLMQHPMGGFGAPPPPGGSSNPQGTPSSPVPPTMPMFPPPLSAFPPLAPPGALQQHGHPMGHFNHQMNMNLNLNSANPLSPSTVASPTFPSSVSTPSPPASGGQTTYGIGTLVWLSSKAGLVQGETENAGKVSFQLKDFCDQAVVDLTAVLRPGFSLQYWASVTPSSGSDGPGGVATFVRPLPASDRHKAQKSIEAHLEAPEGVETGPPQLPKDPYHLDLEEKAVPMLLNIFQNQGLTYCQLSSFHMQISNCGDENLYRYVGTSSLKRRQFLERRTHLFHISQSDTVSLQPPALYTTIQTLVGHLLKRGGACLLQELFDEFNGCPEIPLEARDCIGEGKNNFLRFLEAHPWLFAVFPSRVFVSVRRQLPKCDYAGFMAENFGDMETGQFFGGSNESSCPPTPNVDKNAPPPSAPSNWPLPPNATSGPTMMEDPLASQRPIMTTNLTNGFHPPPSGVNPQEMISHHGMGQYGQQTHAPPPMPGPTPGWMQNSGRPPFELETSFRDPNQCYPLANGLNNGPTMLNGPPVYNRGTLPLWGGPPPPLGTGVGGKIKRFVDTDAQTGDWAPGAGFIFRPPTAEAQTQTEPAELRTTGSGPETGFPLTGEVNVECRKSNSNSAHNSVGFGSSPISTGGEENSSGVFHPDSGFDPMLENPLSATLHRSIKHFSLSD